MAHDTAAITQASCPACEYDPFTRNAYWTGKLMLARDFIDEQHYVVQKLRHHNQTLHGWGVVCGLKVVQHDKAACRSRYVHVEPGTAVDCCGHDIVLRERDILDLWAQPALKALRDKQDTATHTLQICIRYRECTTEDIPVLYDECGCDDSRCAPNRILESYELGVIVDPDPAATTPAPAHCGDLWKQDLDGCPHCDQPDCVVLATIDDYVVGNQLVDPPMPSPVPAEGAALIDNLEGRRLLPSVQTIKEVIDCMLANPGSAKGIDAVKATFIDCSQAGSASLDAGPPRTLVLEIPRGCDGKDGINGTNGKDGVGLEKGLTRIKALSWLHGKPSVLGTLITTKPKGRQSAVIIEFDHEVDVSTIDSRHVFRVLREDPAQLKQGLYCRCAMLGQITAAEVTQRASGNDQLITEAKQVSHRFASAVAFYLDTATIRPPVDHAPVNRVLDFASQNLVLDFSVELHCAFVLDKDKRAVDGEFTRAELPTGDRPKGSEYGIQGGVFESWFTVKPHSQQKPTPARKSTTKRVSKRSTKTVAKKTATTKTTKRS